MLLHINPRRQRGKHTGSLARASGRYMTFFAAGVIAFRSMLTPCRVGSAVPSSVRGIDGGLGEGATHVLGAIKWMAPSAL